VGVIIDEILPALLKTLSDPADEVVLLNLQVVRWQLFPSQIGGIALECGSDIQSEKCYASLAMGSFIDEILPALLKTLSDPADEVVLLNLQVLRWQLLRLRELRWPGQGYQLLNLKVLRRPDGGIIWSSIDPKNKREPVGRRS
jgi:hypothetical protein